MGKFRIKISSSWFSKDFIVLRYSTNGIFWKSIKCYHYDISEKWCYMSTKTSHFSDAKYLLSKFKTIQDVKRYENQERQRVIRHNAEISEINKNNKDKRDKVYSQFS